MPANRLAALAVALLLLLIPAVSAEEQILYDSGSNSASFDRSATGATGEWMVNSFVIYDITQWRGLSFIYTKIDVGALDSTSPLSANPSYSMPVTLKIGTDIVGHGEAGYNCLYNSAGSKTGVQLWIELSDWNIKTYTGTKTITIVPDSGLPFNNLAADGCTDGVSSTYPIGFYNTQYGKLFRATHYARASYEWENRIDITDESVSLTRIINGVPYASTFTVVSGPTLSDVSAQDISFPHTGSGTWTVIAPSGEIYTGNIEASESSGAATATVYVQSSQTGALLANAQISISAAAGDPPTLTEVINATLPGGTATYTLQPTGTADPYPLYYRANATVPGYSQIIENHSFTLTGPHDVIIEMRPDGGGPTDPENCYLEFYVRDLNANSIPSATVECDGQIRTTNSQGYTLFEVSKNSSYPYTVRKSGYVTIQGSATVADAPRYPVNVVLGPGTVPTYTPTPTAPGATPTPDTRTNEQKGQEVIDLIADFALPIAILAILATLSGLLSMMMPRRR